MSVTALDSFSQSNQQANSQAEIEFALKISLTRTLYQELKKEDFGAENINNLSFYRYKITESDSVIFQSQITGIQRVNKILHKSFFHVIDSIKAIGQLPLLKRESYTYLPVIILAKIRTDKPFHDSIPVFPFENMFNLGYNTETKTVEAVYRTFGPIIYSFPVMPPRY